MTAIEDVSGQEQQEKTGGPRRWLGRATWGFVALLALVLVLLDWRGGCEWRSSLLLFFPSQCWLAPLLILVPAALVLNRRLCWLLLGAAALVFFGYMHFHLALGRSNRRADLIVLSNNIDHRNLSDLWELALSCNPDILAFQESGGWGPTIRAHFTGRHISTEGQFTLVSRFPIVRVEPVPGLARYGRPVAMRCELLVEGRPFVVYNVHMPTPRFFFRALRDDALLREEPSTRLGLGQSWRAYAEYWEHRIELTRNLRLALEHEQKPFMLAGDFNMPDHGMLYHELASQCTDAFARTGWGYGLSFPGNYGSVVSLYRPWLRIDYQFAGGGVIPLSCEVEPWTWAKHLALVGKYQLPAH